MNVYWSIAVAAIFFLSGWEIHTWKDGYDTKNQAIAAEHSAAAGEGKIIKDSQNLAKDVKNDKKDGCLQDDVPAPVLKQLQ